MAKQKSVAATEVGTRHMHPVVVATGLLDGIERRVGVGPQGRQVEAVLGENRDANTG